jgi:hypothetical protein
MTLTLHATPSVRVVFAASLVVAALISCRKPEKPKEWDEDPVEPGRFLARIDGSSDHDVWVIGNDSTYQYDGTRWYKHNASVCELSVVGPDDVWLGGYMGTVIHYDGMKLDTFVIDYARKHYKDVRGIAAWPGEVWVTIDEAGYYRRTGTEDWVHEDPPALRGWFVSGLWGKKKTDVWAAIHDKSTAKVAHLQNDTWTIIDRPPGYGFAGSATSDVWFMGADAMVHWDGSKLTDHPLPVKKARIYGLAASSPTDALVVGENGLAIRWDGSKWNELPRVGNYSLNRAFAAPGGRYRVIAQGSVWVRNRP